MTVELVAVGRLDHVPDTPPGDGVDDRQQILLAETEDGPQSFVDTPLLIWRDPSYQVAEPPGVDGAGLLDENAGSLAQQFYLRTK